MDLSEINAIQTRLREKAKAIGLKAETLFVLFDAHGSPTRITHVDVGDDVSGTLTQVEEALNAAASKQEFERLAADSGILKQR